MAFVHGSKGAFFFRHDDYSPVIQSVSLDINVSNHDTTVLGAEWKTNQAGIADATMSWEGLYEPAYDDTLYAVVSLPAADSVATYCPGGRTAGSLARLVLVNDTALGTSGSADDLIAMTMAMAVDGAVQFGWLLHPFGEDTNTTTGTGLDGTASTSTGWTAHLHVSAVDGGSWVIKLEDSADNSNWSDVTGGAFTAATTSTSERIQSASTTTTLRRYVRYTATRTGGSAGNGITFGLAFSRSKTT
jgi:hypothetical protein